MNRKKLLLSFIIGLHIIGFSQERLVEFENNLNSSRHATKEVFQVVNQENNDFVMFFINAKQVHSYMFNEDFEIKNKLSLEDKRRKYNTIIGYGLENELNYNLFLTNEKHNKFAGIGFSFDGQVSYLQEFNLSSYKEKFIQTVTIDNKFYMFTINSETSILNIYEFDGVNLPKPHRLNFQMEEFLGRDGKSQTLYNVFKINSRGNYVNIETNKIDNKLPNPIEVTSKEKKLYVIDDQVVFTFDNYKHKTQILTINIKDYSYDIKTVTKPLESLKLNQKSANTYINNDRIYTIASNNKEMQVNIKNYHTGEIIKEINLKVEDSISFKNTPIIQEGGIYDNYRELESTKKFLRKISSGDLGISAYEQDSEHIITIGSEKEVARGGGMMMPMGGFGGIPIATMGNSNIFFNPTYFAYNAYTSSKSTRIECLFDADFNHLDGDIKPNVFDRIDDYIDDTGKSNTTLSSVPSGSSKGGYQSIQKESEISNKKETETIFRYKDYIILGNFTKGASKTYFLTKFTE